MRLGYLLTLVLEETAREPVLVIQRERGKDFLYDTMKGIRGTRVVPLRERKVY